MVFAHTIFRNSWKNTIFKLLVTKILTGCLILPCINNTNPVNTGNYGEKFFPVHRRTLTMSMRIFRLGKKEGSFPFHRQRLTIPVWEIPQTGKKQNTRSRQYFSSYVCFYKGKVALSLSFRLTAGKTCLFQ